MGISLIQKTMPWTRLFFRFNRHPISQAGKRISIPGNVTEADLLAAKIAKDDLPAILPYSELTSPTELNRRRLGIAQILLGALAEKRFEDLINSIAGKTIQIEDHRPSRTDTDYRLLNGGGRPVCGFNIKFHGTLFRAAKDYVGLEPQDCFALATYKIRSALRRQTEEALPYVFGIPEGENPNQKMRAK